MRLGIFRMAYVLLLNTWLYLEEHGVCSWILVSQNLLDVVHSPQSHIPADIRHKINWTLKDSLAYSSHVIGNNMESLIQSIHSDWSSISNLHQDFKQPSHFFFSNYDKWRGRTNRPLSRIDYLFPQHYSHHNSDCHWIEDFLKAWHGCDLFPPNCIQDRLKS